MHIRWSRCPHCGKTIDAGLYGGGPIDSKLGQPKVATCPRCGRQFTDGSKEWDDMGVAGKAREGCLAVIGGLLYAPVLGAVGGFFLSRLWDDKGSTGFAVFCAVVAVAVYYYGFSVMVRESKERTDSRKAVRESTPDRPTSMVPAPEPAAPPNLTALFAPIGHTQRIYEAIRLGGWQLCNRVRTMVDGAANEAPMAGHMLSASVAYSAVIMFLTQLAKNPAWAKSHEFTVVYGQTVLLMQVVLSDRQVEWRRYERLNMDGLQKAGAHGDSERWASIAKADFGDMEGAFLFYVDNYGKSRVPDQQMLDVFMKKAAVPDHRKPDVASALRLFMASSRTEFANLQ